MNLSRKVGWIAGFVLALDPLIGLTTYQIITETVFIGFLVPAVLMLGMYFKTRGLPWLAGSAVLFGMTSLTRPIGQLLPFVLVPLFFMVAGRGQWRSAWKGALFFIFVSLLLTSTWAYRNYRVANVWALSAISDKNLLYYRARDVIAEAEGIDEDEASAKLKQLIQSEVEADHLSTAEEVHLMRSTALGIFRQYPKITFMVHAEGLIRVLVNPGFNLVCSMLDGKTIIFDSQRNIQCCESNASAGFVAQSFEKLEKMSWLERLIVIWGMLLLMGIYLGSVVGTWKLLRERQWYLLYLLVILIAYFSVLSAGGESVSRFRIPFIPFLAIMAGIGFVNPVFTQEHQGDDRLADNSSKK